MYIFQSEQVITSKLQFCLKITSLIFKSPDLSPLDYRVGAILGRYTRQNQTTLPSWRLPCFNMEWFATGVSLIRQSCHFKRGFNSVLLQLADTFNTQFKYREGSWHSLLKHMKCLWKCAKFDSLLRKTYWIFRTRLHVHLKKWTLKKV